MCNKQSKLVEDLIQRMTLEEKAGQLNLLHGAVDADREAIRKGAVTGYLMGPQRWDRGASFSWVDELNSLQEIAVTQSRLGIPLLFSRDVIHGHQTVFPIPLGQAASFNTEMARCCAEIAACESSAQGVRWNYSPMIDVARDPRWGRMAEGYGEDPYLCSKMAEALVCGYQSENLQSHERIAACAKHFAGYGAGQGGRDYDSAELSDAALRNIYLPSFCAAVKAGVASIMAGLHDLNGTPMTVHRKALTILRDEWGFQGLIVSDWGAVHDLCNHRVAKDEREAVIRAIEAGIEVDMVSGFYEKHLPTLTRQGLVSEEVLNSAVRRVLQMKIMLGLFDKPYLEKRRERSAMVTVLNRRAAFEAAKQATVLLKNESCVLPIQKEVRSIAVVGPLAEAKSELLGTWVLDGKSEDVVSVIEGIRNRVPSGVRLISNCPLPECALAQAQEADLIIAVIGEHPTRSGEAASVANTELPTGQAELLTALARFNIPIVAVVLGGRALVIEQIDRLADAVLYCFHPGIEGGNAIAELLFGGDTPSGKLPVTLPRAVGQIPVYYSRRCTGRPPKKDARYTTKYIDLPDTPLYPFGFGLSYTNFEYSNLSLSPSRTEDCASVTVSITVTNCGKRKGTEVAQLYIRDEIRTVAPPEWELKGFQRVNLAAEESVKIGFEVSLRDLAFWSEDRGWVAEAGSFIIRVGGDSASGPTAKLELEKDWTWAL